MVGRVCPQAGVAGTKAERGHSCPEQRRTEVKLSDVPILLGIRELLRTGMSALRWRPKNLRGLRRLSHIVIQRAESPSRRAGDSAPYLWNMIGRHYEPETFSLRPYLSAADSDPFVAGQFFQTHGPAR